MPSIVTVLPVLVVLSLKISRTCTVTVAAWKSTGTGAASAPEPPPPSGWRKPPALQCLRDFLPHHFGCIPASFTLI